MVNHVDSTTDLVSACARFSDSSSKDYLNIWSVVTSSNTSVGETASLELEVDGAYSECLTVRSNTMNAMTHALLRNADDGTHTMIIITPSSRRRL